MLKILNIYFFKIIKIFKIFNKGNFEDFKQLNPGSGEWDRDLDNDLNFKKFENFKRILNI